MFVKGLLECVDTPTLRARASNAPRGTSATTREAVCLLRLAPRALTARARPSCDCMPRARGSSSPRARASPRPRAPSGLIQQKIRAGGGGDDRAVVEPRRRRGGGRTRRRSATPDGRPRAETAGAAATTRLGPPPRSTAISATRSRRTDSRIAHVRRVAGGRAAVAARRRQRAGPVSDPQPDPRPRDRPDLSIRLRDAHSVHRTAHRALDDELASSAWRARSRTSARADARGDARSSIVAATARRGRAEQRRAAHLRSSRSRGGAIDSPRPSSSRACSRVWSASPCTPRAPDRARARRPVAVGRRHTTCGMSSFVQIPAHRARPARALRHGLWPHSCHFSNCVGSQERRRLNSFAVVTRPDIDRESLARATRFFGELPNSTSFRATRPPSCSRSRRSCSMSSTCRTRRTGSPRRPSSSRFPPLHLGHVGVHSCRVQRRSGRRRAMTTATAVDDADGAGRH